MELTRFQPASRAPGRNSENPRNSCAIRLSVLLALTLMAPIAGRATADEGGVSFWLPGQFGSLAAAPLQPGWSMAFMYYHNPLSGKGAAAAARQATIGGLPLDISISLDAGLRGRSDLFFATPGYVFATPVLGGQLALGITGTVGHVSAGIDGTLTLAVNNVVIRREGSISDASWGFSDLYPLASLRWNNGAHNVMTYVMGGIPVGTYDHTRLANVGIGHAAIDAGAGYTYLDPDAGNEFSFVTGLTYNLENPHTNYRNGIDWHLDWGASRFVTKQIHVGLVGYIYQQLTPDKGQPVILGDFKSRIAGIGPQVGFIFPLGDLQGYLHLKGYKELAAENRPEGWNAWLTFEISPSEPQQPAVSRPRITK
jgi:hypothetical protein